MDTDNHDIVVIGASAGGFEVVGKLLSQLNPEIPASVFIVIHLSANNTVAGMVNYLQKQSFLTVKVPENFEHIQLGTVYLAPPDHHMLINGNHVLINRGPRENKYRPSIDLLFRSAAAHFGPRVVGVILSGMMEDGTSGMEAIKRSGGISVIQDPKEAPFPDMPMSVLGNTEVDYTFESDKIGIGVEELIHLPAVATQEVPEDIIKEAGIAERISIGADNVESMGTLTPIVCPDCGGSLWQTREGNSLRFRCHIGHAFTGNALLTYKSNELEETMWVVLRMLEERRNLLKLMAEKDKKLSGVNYASLMERAEESKTHIDRIREILLSFEKFPDHPVTLPKEK
jgi:two-component system, chemotaxis family, protein-glutamate methylesterase/glutaminase